MTFTFDDGPSEWTEPILDLLKAHDEQAVFFVTGCRVHRHERTLRRAVAEGHTLGNHGWSHRRLTELEDESVRSELDTTSALIKHYSGVESVTLWRAPHFDHDQRVDEIAREFGLEHIGADVDPADWKSTENQIVRQVKGRAGVVVLHDGVAPGCLYPDRSPTVNALRRILEA